MDKSRGNRYALPVNRFISRHQNAKLQNWVKAITSVPGGVKTIADLVTLLNFARISKKNYGLIDEDKKNYQLTRRFHQASKKLETNRKRV